MAIVVSSFFSVASLSILAEKIALLPMVTAVGALYVVGVST